MYWCHFLVHRSEDCDCNVDRLGRTSNFFIMLWEEAWWSATKLSYGCYRLCFDKRWRRQSWKRNSWRWGGAVSMGCETRPWLFAYIQILKTSDLCRENCGGCETSSFLRTTKCKRHSLNVSGKLLEFKNLNAKMWTQASGQISTVYEQCPVCSALRVCFIHTFRFFHNFRKVWKTTGLFTRAFR